MAIHIGHARARLGRPRRRGRCASSCPRSLIVSAIAWAYVRFGTLPEVAGVLYGVKPVIIAVVVQALWGLGRSAVKTPLLARGRRPRRWRRASPGVNELIVLLVAGAVRRDRARRGGARAGGAGGELAAAAAARRGDRATATATAAATTSFGLWPLFLFFLKVGSVLFGSGYVLLAFLRADLVERLHWLTEAQLLDAVAVGQVTPGPVFTTATFVGYVLGGPAAAPRSRRSGIFLPAFVFVAISGPLVPRIRRSPAAGAFLDGVNVASLALMAVVTVAARRAPRSSTCRRRPSPRSAARSCLIRYRPNSAWLVLGGAIVGVAHLVRSVVRRRPVRGLEHELGERERRLPVAGAPRRGGRVAGEARARRAGALLTGGGGASAGAFG